MRESLTALLAALLTAVTLFAFAGYQVTGEDAAMRLLGRLAASLVELDRWVPAHREDIQLVARDRPEETVLINDLPVDVVVPSSAVLDASNEDLRDLLRRAMGHRLYDEGSSSLQDEEGGTHLPVTEPLRWTVSLLGSGMHVFWTIVTLLTGIVTLALLASLGFARRSPMLPVVFGALAATAGSVIVWVFAGFGSSAFEGAVDQEIMLIVRDGAWLGLRNSLAVAVISLAALYLWRTIVEPRRRYVDEYWTGEQHWPDFEQSDGYPGDTYPSDPR